MLYLKDGPLRSSNYFQLFLCQMYALKYFAGNIERQGGEGGGEPGVGEEEEDEGGNFKFLFFSVNVNTVNIINLIFFL